MTESKRKGGTGKYQSHQVHRRSLINDKADSHQKVTWDRRDEDREWKMQLTTQTEQTELPGG